MNELKFVKICHIRIILSTKNINRLAHRTQTLLCSYITYFIIIYHYRAHNSALRTDWKRNRNCSDTITINWTIIFDLFGVKFDIFNEINNKASDITNYIFLLSYIINFKLMNQNKKKLMTNAISWAYQYF